MPSLRRVILPGVGPGSLRPGEARKVTRGAIEPNVGVRWVTEGGG
jgi:hypothetical protein